MPPIPPWNQVHPLVVHFPIALTFVVPIFLLLAAILPKARLSLLFSAGVISLLAAIGSCVATASGDATEHAIQRTPEIRPIIHEHEELGELARNVNIGAAVIVLAAWVVLYMGGTKIKSRFALIGLLILTALYIAPMVIIAKAGHEGGRLVHEFGVKAWATTPHE